MDWTWLPCPSPPPLVCPSSWPMKRWCHPTSSSSVVHRSSCLQYFPPSGSFPISQLFTSGGHIVGASASVSVLSMIIQNWFPLKLTGWISWLSKGFLSLFSSDTILKHNEPSGKTMKNWLRVIKNKYSLQYVSLSLWHVLLLITKIMTYIWDLFPSDLHLVLPYFILVIITLGYYKAEMNFNFSVAKHTHTHNNNTQ